MNMAQSEFPAGLSTLLTQGGDERIWCEPATGRNRYGVAPLSAPDEIWLSSSTASAVSARGLLAIETAMRDLMSDPAPDCPHEALFEDIRRRLRGLYGAPLSEVVLAPSGTEAELLVVSLAHTLMPGPLTNIVIAPSETGSGIVKAAGGTWFLDSTSLSVGVRAGDRLPGLGGLDIEVATVEVRDGAQKPRHGDDIDAEVVQIATHALAAGRNVLVHLLDTSKTGLAGFSREAAMALARDWPGRVLIAVDACQLRCSSDRLRRDLAAGFLTLVTGSKFAGGPPFSAALSIPEDMAARLARSRIDIPGLACFSALSDWPALLRPAIAPSLAHQANAGLGLRWIAALDALESFEAIDARMRTAIAERFQHEAIARIERAPMTAAIERPCGIPGCPTIVPFALLDRNGDPADMMWTKRIHGLLREPRGGPAIHVGQAVALGRTNPLRICASASHFVDIAERHARSGDLESAFAPLLNDLDRLFEKLGSILAMDKQRA